MGGYFFLNGKIPYFYSTWLVRKATVCQNTIIVPFELLSYYVVLFLWV